MRCLLYIALLIFMHARRIGISEILHWDRKFHLTLVILSRLSREVDLWLYWNLRIWSSSDTNIMLKRRHHVMSHLSVFRNLCEAFFKNIKCDILWRARKVIHYSCECGKKSVPRNHCLSSIGKPPDAHDI